MDKEKLDNLLELHRAQPVGHGYIDIIVSRDNYKPFIADLIKDGFVIESISWWEWCEKNKECEYGLGGPKSNYYDGWFSELAVGIDDIKSNEDIIDKIETKEISFPDQTVTFKHDRWLTPAFWLNVPDDWRNKYPDSQ